ncbi:hypothetical protein EGW08_004207 [Elysia chlorotica]|uniref:Uncharacterized protein n=1 Tax=Elysia chlorotica TaxID=188477 RepID=A0A433U2J5_ELYCH|nr:hypothetical protein EGW08_004207 [Elysia chlorotica]
MDNPQREEDENEARRLREVLRGRINQEQARRLLDEFGDPEPALDFVLNGSVQSPGVSALALCDNTYKNCQSKLRSLEIAFGPMLDAQWYSKYLKCKTLLVTLLGTGGEGRLLVPKSASLSSNHDVPGIMVGDEDDRCRPKIKGQVSIFSGKCLGPREDMTGIMVSDEDDRYGPKIKEQAERIVSGDPEKLFMGGWRGVVQPQICFMFWDGGSGEFARVLAQAGPSGNIWMLAGGRSCEFLYMLVQAGSSGLTRMQTGVRERGGQAGQKEEDGLKTLISRRRGSSLDSLLEGGVVSSSVVSGAVGI